MTVYRTVDLARWGTGKGSDLTPTEGDRNLWDIIQRIITLEARPDPSAGIDFFSTSGTQFYVHMTDTTVLGPYDLPQFDFLDRGTWAATTAYAVNDTFTINGGLYRVMFAHTSASSFDAGANDGSGHDYYRLWFQAPGTALPTGGAVGQVITKSTTSDFQNTYTWKFPDDGEAGQVLIQQSSTQDDAAWGFMQAEDVEFTPVTGSTLAGQTNVADALEELAGRTITADAADIVYTPSTGSGLSDTNVQDALDTLGERSGLGKQTMWIPAQSMIARNTNGPSPSAFESSGNKIMSQVYDFDSVTQEYVQFTVAMPKSWDEGDFTFKVFWSHPSTSTNFGVAFGLEMVGLEDDQTIDRSFGTTVYVNDTGGITDYLYVSDESNPVTPNGTTTYGALMVFQVCRYPADAGDTLTVDARLHGVQVLYTVNASSDS